MQNMNILKGLNRAKIRPLENLKVLRYKTEQTRGIKDNFHSKQYLNFKQAYFVYTLLNREKLTF